MLLSHSTVDPTVNRNPSCRGSVGNRPRRTPLNECSHLHHRVDSISFDILHSTVIMADVPLLVVSDNSSSERRITPSWSISTLKAKLEPVTGVPPSSQRIFLKTSAQESIPITANDEDSAYLASFPLAAYAELHVSVLLGADTLTRWPSCPFPRLRFRHSFPKRPNRHADAWLTCFSSWEHLITRDRHMPTSESALFKPTANNQFRSKTPDPPERGQITPMLVGWTST